MELDEKRVPEVFRALCDANRVRILKYLMHGEKCACRLLEDLDIAQSTLSHHMKILTDSGLVTGRRDGKWMHYCVSGAGVDEAAAYLNVLRAAADGESEPCGCGSEAADSSGCCGSRE